MYNLNQHDDKALTVIRDMGIEVITSISNSYCAFCEKVTKTGELRMNTPTNQPIYLSHCIPCKRDNLLVSNPETCSVQYAYSVPVNPPSYVSQPYRRLYQKALGAIVIDSEASQTSTRKCVEQILKREYGCTQKFLYGKIEQACKAGHLSEEIRRKMHKIRLNGNDGTHDLSEEPAENIKAEAEDSLWILKDILQYVFKK